MQEKEQESCPKTGMLGPNWMSNQLTQAYHQSPEKEGAAGARWLCGGGSLKVRCAPAGFSSHFCLQSLASTLDPLAACPPNARWKLWRQLGGCRHQINMNVMESVGGVTLF